MEHASIAIIVILAIGIYFIFFKKNTPPIDLNNPDIVLNEIEVYLAYGKKKQAIALLEKALTHGTTNAEISAKLRELRG
jgi:hypothetical protein